MDTFDVWLRPLGDVCRIRVDNVENAKWLIDRLRQSVLVEIAEPFKQMKGTSECTFEVTYQPSLSRSKFENLLATIPEVKLMTGPEVNTTTRSNR